MAGSIDYESPDCETSDGQTQLEDMPGDDEVLDAEVLDDEMSVDESSETKTSAVGWLWYINEGTDERAVQVIKPGCEFTIGRGQVHNILNFYDETISNHHLRLRSIVYDSDDFKTVPPMLYVEDTSTNGTIISRPEPIVPEEETQYDRTRYRINAQTGPQLLEHGDELFLSTNVKLQYCAPKECRELNVMNAIQTDERMVTLLRGQYEPGLHVKMFSDNYRLIERRLGVGGQGYVLAALHLPTRRQMACKVIDLHALKAEVLRHMELELGHHQQKPPTTKQRNPNPQKSPSLPKSPSPQKCADVYCSRMQQLVRRIEHQHAELMNFSHPNIVDVEQIFITSHNVYIMQELITGGDLYSYLMMQPSCRLSEVEAAVIIRQLLDAVDYLHRHGFVHRDLKPENILLERLKADCRIILTDFGLARRLSFDDTPAVPNVKKRTHTTSVGTKKYAAPEVFGHNRFVDVKAGYTNAVDLWSVGTITAMLLTGDVIYVGAGDSRYLQAGDELVQELAAQCHLTVIDDETNSVWQPLSGRAKSFVKELLVLDESDRLTAKTALKHSWFTHPTYARELQQVYERAVRDFRPAATRHDIGRFDTSWLGASPLQDTTSAWQLSAKSKYFPTAEIVSDCPVPT